MTHRDLRCNSQAGFTLVEIAVVIVIIAVLLSMALVMTRGVAAAQKRSITASRMAAVDLALVQFVALNRRLPCPADGTIASTGANPGVEVRAAGVCTGGQQNGVVPWVTLGLAESDATDGWDRRLTYRTDADLVLDGAMDMSYCDPAGTAAINGTTSRCETTCTAGAAPASCTPPGAYLIGKGLEIRNSAGTPVMQIQTVLTLPTTSAAYVVISHGESGGGAYLSSGQLSASATTDGSEEQKNYASAPLAGYYVDDATTDVAGASHFDDLVSRPSVLSLAFKAGLGPRAH